MVSAVSPINAGDGAASPYPLTPSSVMTSTIACPRVVEAYNEIFHSFSSGTFTTYVLISLMFMLMLFAPLIDTWCVDVLFQITFALLPIQAVHFPPFFYSSLQVSVSSLYCKLHTHWW